MSNFMKSPCNSCPFRRDVKPFLYPARAEELAYGTSNPYNSFTCHKTLEHDEELEENYAGEKSKECAGFLSMQHNNNGKTSYDRDGFEPSELVYDDPCEMVEAYEEQEEVNNERYQTR
ncbi:hypothetical protein GD1_162 [Paraglaciecola Antarctic GD virus 1]|nr:hypothetical protein GD1_162 [Paraglaciecola Antarctic GD virus 1]